MCNVVMDRRGKAIECPTEICYFNNQINGKNQLKLRSSEMWLHILRYIGSVIYMLRAGIVKPAETAVSRDRLCKQIRC
jgi:hypothetical protein